jgi:hypothetical protein
MTYHKRLKLFLMWADYYGLEIIKPKFKPDEVSREWAK